MTASGALRRGVLALDTSTECCSVAALLPDGTTLVRATLTERSHAELILPMIDEVLREGSLRLAELDGLAFGRGPGAFTGVRIAAGVAQGLAYGAGLPVVPVSSLAAVAYVVGTPAPILVCNDARMNELYWACYRFDRDAPAHPVLVSPERVGPADSVEVPEGVRDCAGNGLARHPALRERLQQAGLQVHDNLYPRADAIARIGAVLLARGEGQAAADALPVYVRDDVARPARA